MTTFLNLSCAVAALILSSSCVNSRRSDSESNPNTISHVAADSLKFTSGIRSILQDSKGNYWIGSDQEGICRYDGETFTYYTTEDGLCGNQVISIKEDDTGLIWFGTSSGLCSFDGERILSAPGRLPHSPDPLSSKEYTSWEPKPTDLWFPGDQSHELIRVNHGIRTTLKNPIETPVDGNPVDYGLTGFSKGKKGDLWIAYYQGVAHYDGKTTEYINDHTIHFDDESYYMHVRSILEDSQGRLWIGNNGIGLQLKEKDSVVHFSKKFNLLKGEIFRVQSPPGTLMHVFAIKEDSKGNIWFGDRDTGAWRYDGKEITNFVLDPTLKTQHIWDIYEDQQGNLLFASGVGGVYKFNGNGFDRFL